MCAFDCMCLPMYVQGGLTSPPVIAIVPMVIILYQVFFLKIFNKYIVIH
jgi:hypothetical protein